jgi:hypothetical protein
VLAAVLASGTAHADANAADQAAAEGLFSDAKKLMADGNYADACPKLEESNRLDPAPGTEFKLGECYEHVGRTASAWALFLNVAAAAKSAGLADREKVARDRAAELQPKLVKLTITVQSQAQGIEVKRDGVVVGRGGWGSGVALDPGSHVVSATAPGKAPWEQKVVVGSESLTVTVPELTDAAASPATPETPAGDQGGSSWGTQKTLAVVAAGVGVVGIGIGSIFGLKNISKLSDSDPHCTGNQCDATGVSLRDDAVSAGNLSTVGFAIGIVGLAGAAVLWLTAPKSSAANATKTGTAIHFMPGHIPLFRGSAAMAPMLGGTF